MREHCVDVAQRARREWMRSQAERALGVAAMVACGGSMHWLGACAPTDAARNAAAAAAAAAATKAATTSTARVTAYISADAHLAREVLAACTARTGIAIDAVFDTEASKTTGLENRIRAERDRPRADLFWSSESFALVQLASEGLLAPLPSAITSAWKPQYRDAAGHWMAFAARARVLVRHASRPQHPPISSWAELAAARASNEGDAKVAIADPRFGTTRAHLAALEDTWERARREGIAAPTIDEWLDGLRARGVVLMLGGNAACVEAVLTGECAYGCTDSDDALAAIARGLPLEMMLPRTLPLGTVGGGTMLIPNTVGLIANRAAARGDASSAAAESAMESASESASESGSVSGSDSASLSLSPAQRVAAFLVSRESEQLLCASASRNTPLGNDVACEPAYSERDPQAFDLSRASARATHLARSAHAKLTGADS